MTEKKVNYSERFFNLINEATKAFGVITANYTTLIDLGLTYTRNAVIIENTLNQDVKLNFVNSSTGTQEITITKETDYTFDDFKNNGLIQIKAVSDLPTAGSITIKSW
jgi:hypothetical protein